MRHALIVLSVAAGMPPLWTRAAAGTNGASFRGLGDLAGGEFRSVAYGVSADGSVVVGIANHGTGIGPIAFRWTAGEGMRSLGTIPGGSSSAALGVSGDGAVVVGSGTYGGFGGAAHAFRWTASEGMVDLGSLPGGSVSASRAQDASEDGAVIVGDSLRAGGSEAFRWTAESGMTGLGALPGAISPVSEAHGVSADGWVVVGSSHGSDGFLHAFRWSSTAGMVGLVPHPGDSTSAAAVTPDGSGIVGDSNDHTTGITQAFRWIEATGYQLLGLLPGTNATHAHSISADGQVVVGDSQDGQGHGWAFIWTPTAGIRDLKVVLEADFGLNLTGWLIQDARDISDDGATIVGFGLNPCGLGEGWVARLAGPPIPDPPPCPGDVAHDGVVDFLDLNLLLSNYGVEARCGDLNGDGVVNFADLNIVLSNFGTAC